VGNAWEVYQTRMPKSLNQSDPTRVPDAKAMLHLAKARFLKREWVEPHQALPVYLRDNVAKKSLNLKNNTT
ncbi:MAG TPA: tRNA (adenosine(37)-N6)-threonylcarbamoyltransferase complex dimerization subunit type 1 TsaB, partial [Gammaproteobacteria bacterium]|nr:tRNA (adenosine(37)-N6)-threonylcarbamoyltransferase complex dimerization subunit type 1 TsaB [Gammaproteobacteria bacterium]